MYNMKNIDEIIEEETNRAVYEEQSLADILFDEEDLLESGESLEDYYEEKKK